MMLCFEFPSMEALLFKNKTRLPDRANTTHSHPCSHHFPCEEKAHSY